MESIHASLVIWWSIESLEHPVHNKLLMLAVGNDCDSLDSQNVWARQKTSALESFSGCEAVTLDLALWGSLRAPWAHGVLPCLSLPVGGMLLVASK